MWLAIKEPGRGSRDLLCCGLEVAAGSHLGSNQPSTHLGPKQPSDYLRPGVVETSMGCPHQVVDLLLESLARRLPHLKVFNYYGEVVVPFEQSPLLGSSQCAERHFAAPLEQSLG
ncbi:hypothetical protein HPB51_021947 [Rhipicephalus microplus]|uniref:Uncharacterized protein n=1 Tax=Rhipicephalus microplus TaxID=6941 RepID=A0A9J6F9Q2_RHIMP|nr:hypothetical protein HPB51_021947 [Rhipicephalus microplus]